MKIRKQKLWTGLTVATGVLLVALLAGNAVCNKFEQPINSLLNASTTKLVKKGGSEETDTTYYKSNYEFTKAGESKLVEDGKELYRNIVREGATLLKNDNEGLPFSSTTKKLTVYGNAASQYLTNFDKVLTAKGYEVDADVWAKYKTSSTARKKVNLPAWSEVPASEGDTAIVVLGRRAGEGTDCAHPGEGALNKADEVEFPNGDYLSLATTEDEMLKGVKALKDAGKFKKIVLIISTSNSIAGNFIDDPAYGIDAAVWVGQMQKEYAVEGLVDLLKGDYNFSGRIVDTIYQNNLLNPVMKNFGAIHADMSKVTAEQIDAVNKDAYTYNDNPQLSSWDSAVVYQEGIYIGYKYYETRYEDKMMNVANVGDFVYDDYVAYPFGHGLSYTTFAYSNYNVELKDGKYYLSVTVKNTGTVKGKHSVLAYLQKPYTDYAKENNMEQAAVNLVGFGKTNELAPGAEETVTVSVDEWQLRTFDSYGKGTYVYDKGDYYFTLAGSTHEATNNILKKKGNISGTTYVTEGNADMVFQVTNSTFDAEKFANNYVTGVKAEALFDCADLLKDDIAKTTNGNFKYMSRKDWVGTYPDTYHVVYNTGILEEAKSITYRKDEAQQKETKMPTYGANNGLSVVMLKDTPYGDPAWTKLAEQMTYEETASLVMNCWYGSEAVASVGKLQETDQDSSMGRVNPFPASGLKGTDFPSGDMRAATMNRKIMHDIGIIEGEQNLHSSTKTVKSVGLYGFSPNIHRSPYSGRNGEYFSEDAYITGMACGEAIGGMREKGSNCYAKHYFLNDQEDHRHGISTWANEQTIRECYLQGFEYGITMFDGLGLMNSFNRIGMLWSGEHYGSQSGFLYKELGFKGAIVTDMYEVNHQDVIDGLLGETSMWLHTTLNPYSYGLLTSDEYRNDPVINQALQEAAKKMLYVASRTHTINGLDSSYVLVPITPWWKVTLNTVIITDAILLAGFGTLMVLSIISKKKENA
ncbi:MAG: glycoside hydrolase family 3 C-terminal domain-containing protein [Bacillales bacterium]|nr:glycoside hydrolase family 3 C-terminal domain-containing protein [Bacillales bacterium]